MVLSYLNSMYVLYVMYADIPWGASQYDLPSHTTAGVETIVNQHLVL